MPIHVILGKPGSGKSLYATSRVIQELAEGQRNVVTNLPLHPGRLNEYLQQRYPDRDCRMVQRLRVLNDDEIKEFWKYRGPEGGDVEGKHGVAYFLDEAHIAFNARDWATIGRGALHYLSQHRKLGDIVWPITQAPGNLDKQFRSVAEDFTVLRNEYTAKYGPFRGRGRFVRRTYLSEPNGNAEPFEKATFTLDKEGIASCYDTARGIGVHGTKADIGRRAKGLSIWWAFAGAFVLAALVGLIPYALGKLASNAIQKSAPVKHAKDAVEVLSGETRSPGASLPGATRSAPGAQSQVNGRGVVPAQDQPEPWPTGYLRTSTRVIVQMSDGTWRGERDAELTRIERNGAWIDGKKQFYRPSPRPPSPPPAPVLMPAPMAPQPPLPPPSPDTWSSDTGPIGRPSGRIATRL